MKCKNCKTETNTHELRAIVEKYGKRVIENSEWAGRKEMKIVYDDLCENCANGKILLS